MARKPGSGKTPRRAPGAAAPGSDPDRQPRKSGIALPANLSGSLRLLDDAQLDRLAAAVTDEVRRRGLSPPGSPSAAGRSERRTPAKADRAKPGEPDRATTATPGQERLIRVAFEAGLRPAGIAKEFRVSRSAVQHVITAAQRDRRKTER